MGWASVTLTAMTEDGSGDAVLNEGAYSGVIETNAKDHTTNDLRYLYVLAQVEENPADTGSPTFKIEISTSTDAVSYSDYRLFTEGEYTCRAYKLKLTVYGDPVKGQRPKVTAFESAAAPIDARPVLPNVQSTENSPPAGGLIGDCYMVGTGSGAWTGFDNSVMRCLEAKTPTYRRIIPRTGALVYHETDAVWQFYNGSTWEDWDTRTVSTGHITILGHAYSTITGIWAYSIDANQALSGTYYNASVANADEIDYKTCLKKATYTMVVLYKTTSASGILKIYHTSIGAPTLLTTIDMYSGATVNNCESRSTGLAFTSVGLYDILCVVTGKNASSSGYRVDVGSISFFRTA